MATFKTFLSPGGQQTHGVQYLYDPNYVVLNTNNNVPLATGGFRPAYTTDFAANISLTGVTLNTNPSTAITGNPLMTVSNPVLAVSGNFGSSTTSVALTGNPQVNISNPILAVSGAFGSSSPSVAITGNPQVSISNALLAVSGNFSTSITSVAVTGGQLTFAPLNEILALTSGNAFLASISGAMASNLTDPVWVTGGNVNTTDVMGNILLSGISGALTTNLNAAAWVTGIVNIGNTAPIPVSGTFIASIGSIAVTGGQLTAAPSNEIAALTSGNAFLAAISGSFASNISLPVSVTGTRTDSNSSIYGVPTVPVSFLAVGGRAVAATGAGSITGGYNTGDSVVFSFNKDNGGLLCNQGVLDPTQDAVTTVPSGLSTVSNDGVSGLSQTVLAANPNRLAWFIQNLGTGALMVRMSSSLPSTGNLNFVLKGGSSNYDGNGASWSDSPCVYRGPVSVSGFGGAPVLYSAWSN